MLVSVASFTIPPYVLPNITEDTVKFVSFSQAEEIKRLRKILGRSLCDAFIAAAFTLGTDGVYIAKVDADIDQRWKDLRDGVAYTGEDGITHYQEGLTQMMKAYIYSQWIAFDTDKYNGDGGVNQSASENASVVSPAGLIVRAFNEFSLYVGNECRMKNSLYGYLYTSEEKFTDSIGDYTSITEYLSDHFVNPGNINAFNL